MQSGALGDERCPDISHVGRGYNPIPPFDFCEKARKVIGLLLLFLRLLTRLNTRCDYVTTSLSRLSAIEGRWKLKWKSIDGGRTRNISTFSAVVAIILS